MASAPPRVLISPTARRALRVVAILAAAAIPAFEVGKLVFVFASRLRYPMDLEWCEGAMLYHAWRVLHGQTIYGPENAAFLPFSYGPVHMLLLSAIGKGSLDYWSGRLLSIVAFATFCFVVCREVYLHHRETSAPKAALWTLLALGTIAVGFPVVGGWYDLVRVDSLMMALVVLPAALVSVENYRPWRMIVAAVLLTGAIFTKQTSALFALWMVVFVMMRDWRRGLLLAGATGALSAAALALAQAITGGNFWMWIFAHPRAHPIYLHQFLDGLRQLATFAPFVVVVPFAAIALGRSGGLSRRALLWTGMLACAFPAALLPYSKAGGYLNNLMPIVMLAGPVTILLAMELLARRPRFASASECALIALTAAFIASRPIRPSEHIPSTALWNKAAALNAKVAALSGGVLMPDLPFIPPRNGQSTPQLHTMAFFDLRYAKRPYDLAATFAHADAEWIFLSSAHPDEYTRAMQSRYDEQPLAPELRVEMMTGYGLRLDQLWHRRSATP